MTGVALRMSSEAVGWVLREAPDVPAQCVSVLIGLAEHADKRGRGAYPSAGTLASYARKSERQARYDIKVLIAAGLIRPGDQSPVQKYPPNRRPVVYDLAIERSQAPAGVQPIAPPDVQPTAPQGEAGVQPIAPQPARQPIAPLNGADLQEHAGVQPIAPLNGSALGCNTASPGVQPASYKPPKNLKPLEVQVGEGGCRGGDLTPPIPLFGDGSSPGPANGKPKTAAKVTAHRLPEDFQVTAAMVAWARTHVPYVDGRRETEKFINHYTAASGAVARKRDWAAAWRNWMYKADDDLGRAGRQHGASNGTAPNGQATPASVSPRDEHRMRR